MCGINGVISRDGTDYKSAVDRMQASSVHRGPDGAGEYDVPHVHLAMRRLSIIDLNSGWQPLYNEDRSLALVANGEVYNYVELREDLRARGHQFRTGSDCEVIVHLYEEYGLDFVHKLRGMYAFALWDTRRRRLVLVRDRMGEKPLCYVRGQNFLAFSSELRSLIASGLVPLELDQNAIHQYFYYQYVPEPLTPVRNVLKLPPGHLMTVDVDSWSINIERYWRIEDAPEVRGDPREAITAGLEEIGRLIVRADVPIGVALSGGVDSSIITALVARQSQQEVHAFTVGYSGRPESDERSAASQLAHDLKIPFHEVEVSTDEVIRRFPEIVFARDEPIADISGHGYWAVNRAAREAGVPVMIQGHGGDELFWGYEWLHRAASLSELKAQDPNRSAPGRSLRSLIRRPPLRRRRDLYDWGRTTLAGFRHALRQRSTVPAAHADRLVFSDLTPDFQIAERDLGGLYTKEFAASVAADPAADVWASFTHERPWPDIGVLLTALISRGYLLVNGIAQGDRLSMASSVELRLPLIDYRFVETVVGLRKANPDHHLPPKYWFMQAARDMLSPEILARPKRGFTPPVFQWHTALFQRYGEMIANGYLANSHVFTRPAAHELARGVYTSGAIAPMCFKALVFEMWLSELTSQLQLPSAASAAA